MSRLNSAVLASSLFFGALCAPSPAHADSIVVNGNFSQGSIGWTSNPSSSFPWTFSGNGSYTYASTGCIGANCVA
ncbi:MAG TPA: hypothetical protein VM865_06445, partial [Acidobacteriaceae bacterium]|nr:hypothetical protein [Acidobacteriaceae bacterium]